MDPIRNDTFMLSVNQIINMRMHFAFLLAPRLVIFRYSPPRSCCSKQFHYSSNQRKENCSAQQHFHRSMAL